jgi:hypothetical protein
MNFALTLRPVLRGKNFFIGLGLGLRFPAVVQPIKLKQALVLSCLKQHFAVVPHDGTHDTVILMKDFTLLLIIALNNKTRAGQIVRGSPVQPRATI